MIEQIKYLVFRSDLIYGDTAVCSNGIAYRVRAENKGMYQVIGNDGAPLGVAKKDLEDDLYIVMREPDLPKENHENLTC